MGGDFAREIDALPISGVFVAGFWPKARLCGNRRWSASEAADRRFRHALALDARRIGATNLMAMLSAGGEATARFLVCGVFLEEWARAATGSYRPQDDHSSDEHEGSIEPLVKQC